MGKISKLMKLLSASAVVAGANSVALADCELCGEQNHDLKEGCPNFDYEGFAKEIDHYYAKLDSGEKWYLGTQARKDRRIANKYLSTPTSSTISFATPSGETAGSTDTGVATSYDNTWSNTETTIQSSNEKPGASDKLNALKFERTQDLEDSATMVSESDSEEMAELNRRAEIHEARKADRVQNITAGVVAEQTRGEDLQRLFNEENARKEEAVIARKKAGRRTRAKRLAERAQNNIARHDAERTSGRDLQNLFDEDNARKEEARIAKTKEARARDSEELRGMLKDYRGKSRDAIDLEARDLHLQAHLKRNENARRRSERLAKEEARKELNSMMAERLEADREATRAERTERAQELKEKANALAESKKAAREQANAAEKIQNARRAQLARRKADLLRKQEEARKDNAALKITEALRKNKERKEAQRQAQINGDYELAKKLQAEYDAEDRQIRADRLLAEQEQLRENLKAVPVEEAQSGEDFKYESEEAQINSDSVLAAQEQAREYLETDAVAQEQANVAASAGDIEEEVETDSWTIPPFVQDAFRGYDLEYNRNRADRWARGLNPLGIRKLEAMLWLTAIPCKQMMNEGIRMEENIAEAVTAVDGIFPYSGTSAAILNVYNAFEHTETAEFSGGLERLGINELNAVLYYIADQYMHRLMSGKKAASDAFIQLAKAAFECFDAVWEADNAQVASDVSSEKTSDKNVGANAIVENEKPETEEWNLPYRVYYAYCHEIPVNLRPTSVSMKYHAKPALFRNVLKQLPVRRLEAIIYKAATLHATTLQKSGESDSGIIELAKEVGNLFMTVDKDSSNPRLRNVFMAFNNAVDHPNDNPISRQPFERGFKELTAEEQRNALLDIFSVYGVAIINGSRPAHPAFVKFAAEFCKACNSDVFANVPLTFEEFGNEAKSAVASGNNAQKPAVVAENREESKVARTFVPVNVETEPKEDSEWWIPSGLDEVYSKAVFINEGEGDRRDLLSKWGKQLRDLGIRHLEVVMYLAACQYGTRDISSERMGGAVRSIAKKMVEGLCPDPGEANARLANWYHALENKRDAIVEFYNGYRQGTSLEGSFQGGFKRLKTPEAAIILGEIACAYREKLREGKRPSHRLFVDFADEVCKKLSLDGFFNEQDDEDMTHPIYEEFGNDTVRPSASEEVEVRRGILDEDNRALVDPVGA